MHTDQIKKLRWKSRRGYLELDLMLSQFWQQHGSSLIESELNTLSQWLKWDDPDLWDYLIHPQNKSIPLVKKIITGAQI